MSVERGHRRGARPGGSGSAGRLKLAPPVLTACALLSSVFFSSHPVNVSQSTARPHNKTGSQCAAAARKAEKAPAGGQPARLGGAVVARHAPAKASMLIIIHAVACALMFPLKICPAIAAAGGCERRSRRA